MISFCSKHSSMSNLFNSILVFCHSHSTFEGKLQVKPDPLLIKPRKTRVLAYIRYVT